MKKKAILASVLAFPLVFGGVALAGNYQHNYKVTICYKGETKEVKKKFLGYYIEKGATEGECPIDVCPNLPEVQVTVPKGYELKDEVCSEIPEEPPVDVPEQPEKPEKQSESIGNPNVKPNPIVPISEQQGK